ncbi:hypothetical protein VF14_11050 [Nostoc linckia z18]|jgi:hypothetical protein|uniref:Uncharacterized protein n=2 Tax=Nostoc linckia TaxID=92942 RepID=A0A9Q5ZF74_NOSLI|nr:hypothetical protein [Nostoc linckia]PHK40130.1 hypothetical protein VF12_11860 [Nostoc linckia z15]PHK46263.1 hypothetical protein VF13_11875 [Nostoc linckia z16]PHJ66518.1 hypothetical protein VF02_08050 [Nostoc linckia z1]PHJ71393.1 hypothetical protein VF05_07910 [Nostoc linckia z3]PHJ75425.1 hypothetical protein VF03_10950 [Nostoc linckia z2]
MFSISLDGFTTLKRDENFYLWLALTLAIESGGMGDGGTQGNDGDEGTKGQLATNRLFIFFPPRVSVSPRPRVLFPMPQY